MYDGSGERLEQRVTSGGTTTTTRYIGALAQYIIAGTTSWQKYYTFAGLLVADEDGSWHYLLEDQLGTPELEVNGSGAGQSGSLHGPYGAKRYSGATLLGNLGFTGQRKDQTSDLTYFNARYYDQDVGVFLSADTDAAGGLNRYAYVLGNPQSLVDPSGHMECDMSCEEGGGPGEWGPEGGDSGDGGGGSGGSSVSTGGSGDTGSSGGSLTIALDGTTTATFTGDGQVTLTGPEGTVQEDVGDAWQIAGPDTMTENRATPPPEASEPPTEPTTPTEPAEPTQPSEPTTPANELCSFSADTLVATPSGERPIGSLRVGDTVEAYNPTTGKTEPEPVQQVWINHDRDLVDVRVSGSGTTPSATTTRTQVSGHGVVAGDSTSAAVHLTTKRAANVGAGETIHTTANHPWLTADRGWVAAGDLRPGEPLVTLNGGTGIVVWVRGTPGASDRYNLTVSQDHTYAVGSGLWVVHNTCGDLIDAAEQTATAETRPSATAIGVEDAEGNIVTMPKMAFTSGETSPLETGPFQDIVNQAREGGGDESDFAGECGEVGACLALYENADAVKGGYVRMGLYHYAGDAPCSTCQLILQRTANDLNLTIHLEGNGIYDPFDFVPED